MVTPEQLWPPFALTVTTGPLTLQAVRDEDMPALLELVLAGVHDPAVMPFSTPWTAMPHQQTCSASRPPTTGAAAPTSPPPPGPSTSSCA